MADLRHAAPGGGPGPVEKYDEAAELLASIPAKFPGSTAVAAVACTACHALVLGLLKEKRPAEALALLEKVLAAAADSPAGRPACSWTRPTRSPTSPRGTRGGRRCTRPWPPNIRKTRRRRRPCTWPATRRLAQGDFAAALKHADAFLAAYPDARAGARRDLRRRREPACSWASFAEAEKLYAELLAEASAARRRRAGRSAAGTVAAPAKEVHGGRRPAAAAGGPVAQRPTPWPRPTT